MVYIERRPPLTVAGAFRRHERQINRLGTRPLGPVSIGPDEGSLTVTDTAGKVLISMAPEAVRVPYRGELKDLSQLLESQAVKADVDKQVADMNAALAQEATARTNGDAATLTAAKNSTAEVLAVEAKARADAITAARTDLARYADDKSAGAVATAQTYTNAQVAAEAAARTTADGTTLTAAKNYTAAQIAVEAKARADKDASNLQATLQYTDTKVATEAQARAAKDQSNLEASLGYTDAKIKTEATARANGDSSTLSSATAAAQGLANTAESRAKSAAQGYAESAQSSANGYTDQKVNAERNQRLLDWADHQNRIITLEKKVASIAGQL